MKVRSKKDRIIFFDKTFKEDSKHLQGEFLKSEIGGWFLNLDNKNQVAFLSAISSNMIDLTFPVISNWEVISEKYGMKDWDEFTQEDVRTVCVGFHDMTEWDCYPHDLVWFRKFVLYANNHAISNNKYLGKKFGNYTNWSEYFNWLTEVDKIELVKLLVEY